MDDWRDLGGIRTGDGRTIRPGALVRRACPDADAVAAGLARAGTTARAELLRTLAQLDLEAFADTRAALCERLLDGGLGDHA